MAGWRRERQKVSLMFLLDVNLLIALLDEWHPHHRAATSFFPIAQARGWATCPITENAFLRIVGNANYRSGPGSTDRARHLLVALCMQPGHQFWADTQTLRDTTRFATLAPASDLTRTYLLALAVERDATLATFDRHIDPSRVTGGSKALAVLSKG